MADPILIIDPGHGGKNIGGGTNQEFKEKDMNLKISLYQYKRFQELGVPIAITRDKDVYLSPDERTNIVRDSGAKYCISNHINASSSSEAYGAETIHSIYTDGKLANAIYQAIIDQGMPGRRVFTRTLSDGVDYYFMHRETGNVDTIIIEYGFATNPEDTKRILNNWQDYAEAVVRTFCDYIGHKYEPVQKDGNDSMNLPRIERRATVKFEGKELNAYITSDNKSVVEVRGLAEMLGLEIEWDSSTYTIILKR